MTADQAAQLVFQALAAAALVKALVDGVKMAAPDVRPLFLLIAAALIGILVSFTMALYAGTPLTVQNGAGSVLAGLMAALGAVGLHEIGSAASSRRFAALYASDLHDGAQPLIAVQGQPGTFEPLPPFDPTAPAERVSRPTHSDPQG